MQNINYDKLKKFEANISKKLFSYISSTDYIMEILDNLNINHPYFLEDENKMAFNMWFSADYICDNGRTVIENFLEDNPYKLSSKEKSYLEEVTRSHISIFEIQKYNDEYIFVRDVLINEDYMLWEPELENAIEEGELLLTRVGKTIDSYNFIGDISHLPPFAKDHFIEDLLLDFNNIRKVYAQLTMKDYLKKYSLNVYRIYNEAMIDIMDIKDEIDSYVYDELGEFVSYMERKEKDLKIREYASNLINIFEYYLSSQDMLLSDLDQVDLNEFIENSIGDGFIDSKSSLNSYINTLKRYLHFLNKLDPRYREVYSEILNISENRFHYMAKLEQNEVFTINKFLLSSIQLSPEAELITEDFERFIIHIGEDVVKLTEKNKLIRRKDLIYINDLLDIKFTPSSGSPNQRDFPLINFFYHMAIDQGILYIEGDELLLSPSGISFLKLGDEEKYLVLFEYLWGEDFIKNVLSLTEYNYLARGKEDLVKLFIFLEANEAYDLSLASSEVNDLLFKYGVYLNLLGLIRNSSYLDHYLTITPFGLRFFKALEKSNEEVNQSKVIHLEDHRKKNKS